MNDITKMLIIGDEIETNGNEELDMLIHKYNRIGYAIMECQEILKNLKDEVDSYNDQAKTWSESMDLSPISETSGRYFAKKELMMQLNSIIMEYHASQIEIKGKIKNLI